MKPIRCVFPVLVGFGSSCFGSSGFGFGDCIRSFSIGASRSKVSESRLVIDVFALVGLLHQGPGFVDGALGVVVGLDSEAVLVDGPVALACDVEDSAEFDVA